jgi:hypothetical protein
MSRAWQCEAGATLLVPSGPQQGHMHLFALLLDPLVAGGYGQRPHVLLAYVTSVPDCAFDDSCCLAAGEHPFLQHDSYVDYRFTRFEPAEHLQKCVEAGTFQPKEPCSEALRMKILRGALASRRIPREYKKLIESVLFSG